MRKNECRQIGNQQKIQQFLETQIDIFHGKNFLRHNSTANVKNCTYIANILKKVNSYFLANIYHSPFNSIKFETLKPPSVYTNFCSSTMGPQTGCVGCEKMGITRL